MIKATLTQSRQRPACQKERQKAYIRWMLRTVNTVWLQNPFDLIDASNRVN